MKTKPNVVYVFSDQHRAEATGYSGNPDVLTPHLDKLSQESVVMKLATSSVPCCCPYRGTLLTGRYPLTHGVFTNDVHLNHQADSIADAFKKEGYQTGYIGKWHVNGGGRSGFIARDDRQGFDYWKVLECTHDYNHSYYYSDEPIQLKWDGYDAEAQTRDAQQYIRDQKEPFFLVLSWGPPHNPYHTAPERFKAMYEPAKLTIRPNVPPDAGDAARQDLAGYYAHISALDEYVGDLLETLRETGLEENTIFVYASDHGDMNGSQGTMRKQCPWEESIRVPFILKYPAVLGRQPKVIEDPFNSPDIMPTLLGLCDIPIPQTVEGTDYSPLLRGEQTSIAEGALIACIHPSGEYHRGAGGREYRGIRTKQYTYVRDLNGPWLLYDNEIDPYQLHNLCGAAEAAELQKRLDEQLCTMLEQRRDEFLPGEIYMERWGYPMDETGTVPYSP
ncbi:sulfatase family protein [Paenibacillus nasutitermitis]|uniref:Sulfatase/phosphatase n=1 Tax=Paenibacillus nasutitermitis TaxID=1652958 RepID=A0A916YQ96_9BACL|nr:sulfatase [Paenibacillus nasutitermitis]GGD56054.1 sulfatase/phosphatase [Paenibacillus nasutitermitis]